MFAFDFDRRRFAPETGDGEGGGGEGAGAGVGDGGGAGAGDSGDSGAGDSGSGGEGAGSGDFLASLPEDIRGREEFVKSGIDGVDKLARQFLEGQALIGRQGVKLPADDAPAEEWEKFHAALPGVPDDAAGYDFGAPAEGEDYDEASKSFQDALRPALQKAGLSQRQLDVLAPVWNEIVQNQMAAGDKAAAEAVAAAEATLREAHGAGYDEMRAGAQRFYEDAAGDQKAALDQLKLADGTFLMDNALVAEMMHYGFKALSDGGALPGGEGGGGFGGGAAAAKAEIARIRADPEHPYNNEKAGPQARAAANAAMAKLYETAYPGGED